jgi:hypothetical protein
LLEVSKRKEQGLDPGRRKESYEIIDTHMDAAASHRRSVGVLAAAEKNMNFVIGQFLSGARLGDSFSAYFLLRGPLFFLGQFFPFYTRDSSFHVST